FGLILGDALLAEPLGLADHFGPDRRIGAVLLHGLIQAGLPLRGRPRHDLRGPLPGFLPHLVGDRRLQLPRRRVVHVVDVGAALLFGLVDLRQPGQVGVAAPVQLGLGLAAQLAGWRGRRRPLLVAGVLLLQVRFGGGVLLGLGPGSVGGGLVAAYL